METTFTSITVQWQPASVGGLHGGPLGYRIKFAKLGSDDYANMDVNTPYQTQAEIVNLEVNTVYKIKVAGLYERENKEIYSDEVKARTSKNPSSKLILKYI